MGGGDLVERYDGVHPGDLGYAVLTNEWIRLINTQVAAGSLPEVDLKAYKIVEYDGAKL